MADFPVSTRRTRTKGPESTARSEALQRLKALRSSAGRRSEPDFQIKLSDPIYDTVPESDYAALVARRRDDFRDFIVDDDGLGYTDDGQEEDWANPNPNYHSGSGSGSDDDSKDQKKKSKKKKEEVKKSVKPPINPVARQRISSMFTSSVFKKSDRTRKAGSLGSESIIDDVLAEFAPDENDREERRRRVSKNVQENGHRLPVKTEMRMPETVLSTDLEVDVQENAGLSQESDAAMKENVEVGENVEVEKCDSNVEVKVEEKKKEFSLNAKIMVAKDESVLSATEGWKAACRDDGNVSSEGGIHGSSVNIDENSGLELDGNGLLPFYIIDAHEESFGANLGTLYLFGKAIFLTLIF